jgi:hypothetical protein
MKLTKPDIDWLIDSMKRVFPTKEEATIKYDKLMGKLDKFIGDMQTKRNEQTLHVGDHTRIDKRLARLEKHAHIPQFAD